MAQTRIGFIGAGGIAGRHLGNLMGFPDVAVVGMADPARERAQELADLCGAKVYGGYREMLDDQPLDALYICVPPFAHGEPELAAIERGLPFFVEKPLAVDWETAERIGRGVEERGLVTAVGYHWRYLDTVERAQELLRERPAHLAIGYWLDSTPPPPWWRKEDMSGGQMVEQTTHIFDLACLLVGDVGSVYGAGSRVERAEYPDSSVYAVSAAMLRFKSGALGNFSSTCILKWPHRIGLHLFSEGMAMEITEFDLMVDVGQGRPVQGAQGEPFVREDRDFIDAVQGKPNKVRAPYSEALHTHRLTTTIARSMREGRALEISD